jgi:DNA mismatch repair protein MutL
LEVRLRDERAIGQAAAELVRDALGRRPLHLRWEPLSGIAALAHDADILIAESPAIYDSTAPIVTANLPELRLIGQIGGRLLLLEGEVGLYLVDQHRAHERILYERMRQFHAVSDVDRQTGVLLPEPLLVEVSPAQATTLNGRLPELHDLGFRLEEFGGHMFMLRGAPAMPGVLTDDGLPVVSDPTTLASALVLAADDAEEAGDGETWQERLLVRLSCRTAVRRGRILDWTAMRALVTGLGSTGAPAVCPHGSPLLMHVGAEALERQFGWT